MVEYLLIGLCGKKGTGKDTITSYLRKEYLFKSYAFAEPLKKGLKGLFGFTEEQLWGNQKEIIDPFFNVSPRKIMQVFATEIFQFKIYDLLPEIEKNIPKRQFWSSIFKKQFLEDLEYDKILNETTHDIPFRYVISDVRFKHEAMLIKELGGIIIKIERLLKTKKDKHVSETELEEIKEDILIFNDKDIENMKKEIDKIMLETE